MAQLPPLDPASWWGQLGTLLGGGTVGVIVIELIKRSFSRAKDKDTLEVGLRTTVLTRLQALEEDRDAKETQLEELRNINTQLRIDFSEQISKLKDQLSRVTSENIWLRRRWHTYTTWMSQQPGMPTPPDYLFDTIDGPTANWQDGEKPRGIHRRAAKGPADQGSADS